RSSLIVSVFFFSSRRRHTRFSRDWSSDVCSSDLSLLDALPGTLVMAPMAKGSNLPYRRLCVELGARVLVSEMVVARRLKQRRRRSEERRVGEESRSRVADGQ